MRTDLLKPSGHATFSASHVAALLVASVAVVFLASPWSSFFGDRGTEPVPDREWPDVEASTPRVQVKSSSKPEESRAALQGHAQPQPLPAVADHETRHEERRIEGTVYSRNGGPLAGVALRLELLESDPVQALSDDRGWYSLTWVQRPGAPHPTAVRAEAQGYLNARADLWSDWSGYAMQGASRTVDLTLVPGVERTLTVLYEDSSPAVDVPVALVSGQLPGPREPREGDRISRTDENGSVTWGELEDERFWTVLIETSPWRWYRDVLQRPLDGQWIVVIPVPATLRVTLDCDDSVGCSPHSVYFRHAFDPRGSGRSSRAFPVQEGEAVLTGLVVGQQVDVILQCHARRSAVALEDVSIRSRDEQRTLTCEGLVFEPSPDPLVHQRELSFHWLLVNEDADGAPLTHAEMGGLDPGNFRGEWATEDGRRGEFTLPGWEAIDDLPVAGDVSLRGATVPLDVRICGPGFEHSFTLENQPRKTVRIPVPAPSFEDVCLVSFALDEGSPRRLLDLVAWSPESDLSFRPCRRHFREEELTAELPSGLYHYRARTDRGELLGSFEVPASATELHVPLTYVEPGVVKGRIRQSRALSVTLTHRGHFGPAELGGVYRSDLDPSGRFLAGPLPPGAYGVVLHVESEQGSEAWILSEDVEVRSGEVSLFESSPPTSVRRLPIKAHHDWGIELLSPRGVQLRFHTKEVSILGLDDLDYCARITRAPLGCTPGGLIHLDASATALRLPD